MDTLPKEVVLDICEYLDPVSYIQFYETGLGNFDKNSFQYNNKRKEYFEKRGIDVENMNFLSLTNKNINLTIPGDYLTIGENLCEKISINGKNIKLNLNDKTLFLKETFSITGENIILTNGIVHGILPFKKEDYSVIKIFNFKNAIVDKIKIILIFDSKFIEKYKLSCELLRAEHGENLIVRNFGMIYKNFPRSYE